MKLPDSYLNLISEQTEHSKTMQMTALALMMFGGKTLGGNVFNSLRGCHDASLRGDNIEGQVLSVAKDILSSEGYNELLKVLGNG